MRKVIATKLAAQKQRDIEYATRWQNKKRELGLCPCGRNKPRQGKVRCQKCAEDRQEQYQKNKEQVITKAQKIYLDRRSKVIAAYGGVCACCGEDYFPFMCLDHVYGGGNKHQQEVGRGTNYYRWIIDNQFPVGFQILCANCNQAKGTKEKCPCKGYFPRSMD